MQNDNLTLVSRGDILIDIPPDGRPRQYDVYIDKRRLHEQVFKAMHAKTGTSRDGALIVKMRGAHA